MRVFLIYYKAINSLNIPISAAYTLLMGAAMGKAGSAIVTSFALCFATGGLWLSVFLYNLRSGKHYFFYYNNHLSKLRLFVYTTLLNLLLAVLLFIIQMFWQWSMN
jgi:hypothetical protein